VLCLLGAFGAWQAYRPLVDDAATTSGSPSTPAASSVPAPVVSPIVAPALLPTPSPTPSPAPSSAPRVATPAASHAAMNAAAERARARSKSAEGVRSTQLEKDRQAGASPEAELLLLRRAQEAVAGRPSESLALTAEHQRDYPNGIFVQEREVIAIDALLALRQTQRAEARARAFLEAYPRSAHAQRLRALLHGTSGAEVE
jgi:hypothetical protein